MKLTRTKMIEAMLTRDGKYDGRFYVGVLSTGIYCLPSCKAKNPKTENVRFFASREDAVAFGLRGCKRCRSERYPDTLPDWVKRLVIYLRDHRKVRISEDDLVQVAGVDISTIRRHFKERLGITPVAFNRQQRLRYARELIANGMDYLNAAFECGYESSSGFREAFTKQFGFPPGQQRGN